MPASPLSQSQVITSTGISVDTGTPFFLHHLPPCFVSELISLSRAVISIACCLREIYAVLLQCRMGRYGLQRKRIESERL